MRVRRGKGQCDSCGVVRVVRVEKATDGSTERSCRVKNTRGDRYYCGDLEFSSELDMVRNGP